MKIKIAQKEYNIKKVGMKQMIQPILIMGEPVKKVHIGKRLTFTMINVPKKHEIYLRKLLMKEKDCYVNYLDKKYYCRIMKIEKNFNELVIDFDILRAEMNPDNKCSKCDANAFYGDWKEKEDIKYLQCKNCGFSIWEWNK